MYDLDYHSRKSVYGQPKGEIHLIDSSTNIPFIRTMNINLDMSRNKSVTSYHYKPDKKICWLDSDVTVFVFTFEIIQFYHIALSVSTVLNSGINKTDIKEFKNENILNLTTIDQEYSLVTVNIKYEFELKYLSKKKYNSLMNGSSAISGSVMEQYVNEQLDSESSSSGSSNSMSDSIGSSIHHGSGSSSSGMVFSAIIAAIIGFFALVGVAIYLYKLYSRKDYTSIDVDKNISNNNTKEITKLPKLQRISLRDTAKKIKKGIVDKSTSINNGINKRINKQKNDYDEIVSKDNDSDSEHKRSMNGKRHGSGSIYSENNMSHNSNGYYQQDNQEEENDDESDDGAIDVSIITNESHHGLP